MLGEEAFKSFIEGRLPRADDKELFLELLHVFENEGKEGLKKHLLGQLAKLEGS